MKQLRGGRNKRPLAATDTNHHCQLLHRQRRRRHQRRAALLVSVVVAALLACCLLVNIAQSQQQQAPPIQEIYATASGGFEGEAAAAAAAAAVSVVPPPQARPRVRVNIREWSQRLAEEIGAVGNLTSCSQRIRDYFEQHGEFKQLDAGELRDSIINQTSALLGQHRAAVNAIVAEAERAVLAHTFVKNLRINYTDVHRLRNELDGPPGGGGGANNQQQQQQPLDAAGLQALDAAMGSSGASGSGPGSQTPQFTSIGGGTPVPGPPEWQTPVKSIVLQVNKNFGDIPVNTSMSAVHLPLPIYPGLPQIMNGIAWTERLDQVFKRNLHQYAHVHHQYYGDHLGFLRTFPAHKWRIPRTDPDLFDARTRPWYVQGASTPKDMVILVDTSGSMTGLRREIAKGVVFELLDTLTPADYFSVLRFSETVTPVGLPRCAHQLRTPKMSPELELQCRQVSAAQSAALSALEQRECAAFRRQRELSQQWPRDHPLDGSDGNKAAANKTGGGYMSEDAYQTSIANVTNDIRDAYLLPATSRNVRYLKSNFSMPTAGIANFTHALMAAFELLQAYGRAAELPAGAGGGGPAAQRSSGCQQAIMLITDGAIRSHDEVFNRYNYPGAPVRVFTYMIGREVGDISHTKAMACNNRGYYTHVINLGEIREQVQKYPPVMARPLVLARPPVRPIQWTYAYGDETHQVLTDWVLEIKRRERARIMLNEERERLNEAANSSDVINIELTNIAEYDELPLVDEALRNRIICENGPSAATAAAPDSGSSGGAGAANDEEREAMEQSLEDELDPLGYNELACHWSSRRADLLASVVKPVFDSRNTSLMFQRILSKNIWTEQETHVRNAQLLGVAAVDLRIADIMKAAPSYLLGPNGYSILMGPGGFLMHHPDLRALLEDPFDKQSKILKPYFNAVDLTHVEQVHPRPAGGSSEAGDSTAAAAAASSKRKLASDEGQLLKLRADAIRQLSGREQIYVKRAIDCRRRPHVRLQTFHYGPIRDTPYSLMVALPHGYGQNRLAASHELSPASASHLTPAAFDLWTVHPDYKYCEASAASPYHNDSLSMLLAVLKSVSAGVGNADNAGLQQQQQQQRQQPPAPVSVSFVEQLSNLNDASQQRPANQIVCDRNLFESLLFDAAATFESPDSYCGSPLDCAGGGERPARSGFSFYSAAPAADDSCPRAHQEETRSKLANIYGLEMSFLATRSGLTRVRVFDLSARIKKLADLFIKRHSRAVDESWYARTVDWNYRHSEESSVITVPYNAYIRLIAKLRQRITQRHPAANDTRANCDPLLDEAEPPSAESPSAESSASSPSAESGSIESAASSATPPLIQNDEPTLADQAPQQQQQQPPSSSSSSSSQASGSSAAAAEDEQLAASEFARINYNEYSSFDFLDLLVNSSVHVSATRTALAGKQGGKRTPVAVTGLLYDYATFARRFLNATSLHIRTAAHEGPPRPAAAGAAADGAAPPPPVVVDICPGGQCPTRCGQRNDTIDCLLVDNNGFIVVGEELPHIGRSLVDYDEKLMASLVERRIFHKVPIWDYQAICTRATEPADGPGNNNGQPARLAAMSSAAPASPVGRPAIMSAQLPLAVLGQLLTNLGAALSWLGSSALSMLAYQAGFSELSHLTMSAGAGIMGEPMPWQLGPGGLASAQSAIANQSLLALLPNKTHLRPCERLITLYESQPRELAKLVAPNAGFDVPHYYATKCGCSGWYVFDAIPKTNLIMLIVNTTSACRRGCDQPPQPPPPVELAPPIQLQQQQQPMSSINGNAFSGPPANKTAEDQVCAMLEKDAQLYTQKSNLCLAQHPDEAQIQLCGRATKSAPINTWLVLTLPLPLTWLLLVFSRR